MEVTILYPPQSLYYTYCTCSFFFENKSVSGFISYHRAIAALIAYFIIGAIILYVVKGARGVEAIPNYTFWMTLPFLIKVCMGLSCAHDIYMALFC